MTENTNTLSNVLFIPHGGGPLPLLGDESHQELVDFLNQITPTLSRPSSIVVISTIPPAINSLALVTIA